MRRTVAAGVGAANGVDPAQRLVQHERERVQVGLLPHLAAFALLGRHVGERAEHVAGARERVLAGEAGAAEVGQLGGGEKRLRRRRSILGAMGDEHVLGLDVAVDHAARVGVGERAGERDADLEDLLVLERIGGDQPGERVAVDQLGDQVEGVVDRARLVQRDDRGMRQARGRERLARGALAVAALAGPSETRLTATSRCSSSSWARQTTPKPPAPSRSQQPVAPEDEVLARRARRGRCAMRGRVGLLAGARSVQEGARRLHRLPRSPNAGPAPAARRKEKAH